MNASKDISQLIANANEDDLRDIVSGWADKHSDFKDYVRNCLCPQVEDVDFGRKLSQAVNRETKEFFSRHDVREATDWSNVYEDLIKPWSENADSLSTEKLYDLCDVIVKEVGMQVTDEDFYGDDWYGDDFSGSIQDIMDVLGNVVGLLMIREDVGPETLDSLEKLIKTAKKKDVIDGYIGSPYDFILELISIRQNTDEVTCGISHTPFLVYPPNLRIKVTVAFGNFTVFGQLVRLIRLGIRFLYVRPRVRYCFFSPERHHSKLASRYGVRRQLRPLWTFTTDV